MMGDFKKNVDDATDIIISCWDSNQPCDSDGKPLDGLSFDERLQKRLKEMEDGEVKNIINHSL